MADLPNHSMLNTAALRWLKIARADAPPHHLHLLNLAAWGLENGVLGEWPERERPALTEQVSLLFGMQPKLTQEWLLSNPNGPGSHEQASNLLNSLDQAKSPQQAAAFVLNAIWSRQQSQNPALQPAASELPSSGPN